MHNIRNGFSIWIQIKKIEQLMHFFRQVVVLTNNNYNKYWFSYNFIVLI
jgi:hypothetical protein